METRVAIIGIVINQKQAVVEVNNLLNTYCEFIIGRMGLPYRKKSFNLISIAIDAPQDIINALSGKIGLIKGVSAKALYAE